VRNLEAKFKLRNLEAARREAEDLGYVFKTSFRQSDSFFRVQRGRLKLREENGDAALIYYAREDGGGLQLSRYEVFPLAEPQVEPMRQMLSEALGVLGTVKKERMLLELDNLRLHLDRVDGLGDFGEVEAVLAEGEDPASSRRAIDEILAALQVRRTNLISVSYLEMIRPVK
jgi:predicted adenylyl cyclase CyaB